MQAIDKRELRDHRGAEEIRTAVAVEQRGPTHGRRRTDGRLNGWMVAAVVSLLASAALAVPDEWKLPAPHTLQQCR